MRKYEGIWEKLKQAEPLQWVTVSVKSAVQIQTVINMVQNEKCAANVTRKRLDLPAYGTLEIKREPAQLRVSFRLKNAGALL